MNWIRKGWKCAFGILSAAMALHLGGAAKAVPPAPSTNYVWLDYCDFADTTNWTTFLGYAPVSFTNISAAALPNDTALVVDSTNAAWLNYNVIEPTNGWTNLTVDTGSFQMWVMPNWGSSNRGGLGPGTGGRLIEVGSHTTNASIGWWSLYTDTAGGNIYFSAQTNGAGTDYLSAPISWASNQWHLLALTYSPTNTAFYIDGTIAASGSGMTVWPGSDVLANGFWIGSDSNGVSQFHGKFSQLTTYPYVLDANTINANYVLGGLFYGLSLFDGTNYTSAPSTPSYLYSFDAISGPGILQSTTNSGFTSGCVTSSAVWFTNVYTMLTNGTISLHFGITGGSNGVPYDVFATAALTNRYATNMQWAWMGQGYHCTNYTIPNLPTNAACYLILGTPKDSDGDGLTDAYELLVSKTNPYNPNTYGGIPDAWLAMHNYRDKITSSMIAVDPDLDALLNWQEYLWGTDPHVNEGFGIWLASPAGAAGIP